MKTNIHFASALLSILTLGFAGSATATPITITFEGTSSGILDGANFTDESFVFTAVADTGDIQSFGNGVFYDNDSATVDLLGNTYTITTPTSSNLNTAYDVVTFGNDTLTFDSLILSDAVFSGWDMLSSFGPVSGSGIVDSLGFPLQTDGGVLDFDLNNPSTITFTATVIPEPATMTLLALGGLAPAAKKATSVNRPRSHCELMLKIK